MDQRLGNRRKYRFPVNDLTISINGKSYRIFNINEYGVGFLLDAPEAIRPGDEISHMIVNTTVPVKVAGIARHVSQYTPPEKRLYFQPGWVCGTEFSTQHDRDGHRLLETFIAETIAKNNESSDPD
jgi:hypothetical protein